MRDTASVTGENAATGQDGSGSPERITVNLTARASRALELAARLSGDTKTDTINRALQAYAFLEQVTAQGGSVYIRQKPDSELEQVDPF